MWGSVISGGLSFLGGLASNKANRGIASANTAFQAQQSATSYQRSMADMKKAGLNPILAYKQGGASTPSGTTIAQQNVMGEGVNSAIKASTKSAEIKALQASAAQSHSQTNLNKTNEANLHMLRIGYNIQNQTSLADAQLNIKLKKIYEQWIDTSAGRKAAQANIIGNQLNPLMNSASSAKSLTR